MDEETIVEAARACGAVVTVEEHQVHGGMARLLPRRSQQREANRVRRSTGPLGQSGDPVELIEDYGMGTAAIKDAVRRAYARKGA